MSIQGLDKLSVKLDKLSDADMLRAAERGIDVVQKYAKYLCPVHDGELRDSIFTDVRQEQGKAVGTCYTNKEYAPYVEFGTGPKGQENHEGISPNVSPSYTQKPWWIHESQIDARTAEKYGWFHIDTPEGRFYQCSGQAAQPFMYPALKDNEGKVIQEVERYAKEAIGRAIK